MKKFNRWEVEKRNKNWDFFISNILPCLAYENDVFSGDRNSGMFYFESEKFGKIVIYPKADRIHIVEKNRWENGVLYYLNNNILKEKIKI